MKKFLTFLPIICTALVKAQAPVAQQFFGQNAWYTYYVTWSGPPSTAPSPDPSDHFLATIQKAKESGALYCRIGGANANIIGNDPTTAPNPITKEQIVYLVKKIRDASMIPIVQVPYVNPSNNHSALFSESVNAGDIVDYVNNNATVLSYTGGPVEYWIIANEPDKDEKLIDGTLTKVGYDYNLNLTTSPGNIAKYIKQFAIEMRKKDSSIKIIGPELAQYSNHMFFGGMYGSNDFTGLGLMENGSPNDITTLIGTTDELGNPIPTGIQNKPYIDYISFHYYNPSSSRELVIDEINITGDAWKLHDGLENVSDACISSAMIAQRTYSSTNYPLKVALTEANVEIEIPSTDPASFIAGQFWADLISLSLKNEVEILNFWSSAENAYGYMDNSGNKRSCYWHYALTEHYMKSGTGYTAQHYPSTIVDLTSPAPAYPDVKSFASKVNDQVVVVVMNQKNYGGSHSYSINTNGTASDPDIKISYSTGSSTAYQHSDNIGEEETHWVVFNCNGDYEGKWVYNLNDHLNGDAPSWIPASPAITPYHTISASTCTNCTGVAGSDATVVLSSGSGPSVEFYDWIYSQGVTITNPTGDGGQVTLLHQNSTDVYPFIATDPSNGCTTTENFEIYSSGGIGFAFYAYIDSKTPAYCGNNNGTATVFSDGCAVTETYLWDNTETTSTAVSLSPGMHSVTISCNDPLDPESVVRKVFIPSVVAPKISAGPDLTICTGYSIGLQADGGEQYDNYTFNWTPSTGLSSASIINPVASPVTTTTYVLTVTGPSPYYCVSTDTITITVNPVPAAPVLSGDFSTCVLETETPYLITNYNTEYDYSISIEPEGAGTASGIDTTGGFGISWTYNDNSVIHLTATNTYGCSSTADVNVYSCCRWEREGSAVFAEGDNVDNMQALGTSFASAGSPCLISDQQFSINGTFTVNKDLTIKGSDIMLGGNAKIIIAVGKKLIITSEGSDASHLFACDHMWNGIYVDGTNSGSRIEIYDGASVEDALNAIVSSNGGEYRIVGGSHGSVVMNKNYRNVVVNAYSSSSHPGIIQKTEMTCYDAKTAFTYSNDDLLREPHENERTYSGVEVSAVASLTVGINTSTEDNYFDNMDYGIRCSGSNVTVYNNHFENITGSGNTRDLCPPGTAICATGTTIFPIKKIVVGNDATYSSGSDKINTFMNCLQGIVACHHMSADISQNSFSNVGKGISISGNYAKVHKLIYNTMSSVNTGISCFDNNSSVVTITDDNITTSARGSGILVNEVSAFSDAEYRIMRNNIDGARYGIWLSGVSSARADTNTVQLDHTIYSSQASTGITLKNGNKCSVRQNNVTGENSDDWWVNGIFVDLSSTDTVSCNLSDRVGTGFAFAGSQFPGTLIARNIMENNFRGMMVGYGVLGEQYLHGSGSTKYSADNSWTTPFTDSRTESFYSNGALSKFYVRFTGGMPYDPSASGNIANPSSTSGVTPLNFGLVGTNSSLQNCSAIDSQSPDVGQLQLQARIIKSDTASLPAFSAAAKWMMKNDLYNYLVKDSSLLSLDTAVASFFSAAANTQIGKLNFISRVLSDINASNSLRDSAELVNSAMIAANDPQQSQQSLNDILFRRTTTFPEFDSVQLDAIRDIALLCPYSDGKAVLQARAILSAYDTTEYTNECEFFEPESAHSMLTLEEERSPFLLYPNPNKGSMTLLYSMETGSSGEMKIFDVAGKQVLSYQLSPGTDNRLEINDAQLNNGIYLYSIMIDGRSEARDKIIIIR
jgi:hypothetical protein